MLWKLIIIQFGKAHMDNEQRNYRRERGEEIKYSINTYNIKIRIFMQLSELSFRTQADIESIVHNSSVIIKLTLLHCCG